MTTMTASQITDLHARRSAKGDGYAPTLAECLSAAREGRLFDVDTQSAGHDGLTIADDAETALAEWAAATVGPVDGEGDAARFARWTAERVMLDVGGADGGGTGRTTDGFVVFSVRDGAPDYRFAGQALPAGAVVHEAHQWGGDAWRCVRLHGLVPDYYAAVASAAREEAAAFA